MSNTAYSVKLFYKTDIRRFVFPGGSFEQLKAKCLQFYNLSPAAVATDNNRPNNPHSEQGSQFQLPPAVLQTISQSLLLFSPTDFVLKYEDNDGDYVTISSDAELNYALSLTPKLLKLKLEEVSQKPSLNTVSTPSAHDPIVPMSDYDRKDWKMHKKACKEREKINGVRVKPLDARFISHVTCADDCEVPVGTSFQKTWRVRNIGELRWPDGTVFLRVDRGNDLNAPDITAVTPCDPNCEVDVTVPMVCPRYAGRYQSYFKMCTPSGKKFGMRMRCQIMAVSDSSISPERIDKAWEQLEAMGFVNPGERNPAISSLIMRQNCDITKIVRDLVHKSN